MEGSSIAAPSTWTRRELQEREDRKAGFCRLSHRPKDSEYARKRPNRGKANNEQYGAAAAAAAHGAHREQRCAVACTVPRAFFAVQSGVVVVFCQEHNDVDDVARATSSTAVTVSYRSTSSPSVGLPLRRGSAGTARSTPCTRGGTVDGVPRVVWYHGTMGTMVQPPPLPRWQYTRVPIPPFPAARRNPLGATGVFSA